MRKAFLFRDNSTDQGTFGMLMTDTGFVCHTGELPWLDNSKETSCIPKGRYTCTWRNSPRHGMCYHVDKVPHRTDVEIHAANLMGDVSKGFACELRGCIAPGEALGDFGGQKGIARSKAALKALEADLGRQPFELVIQ